MLLASASAAACEVELVLAMDVSRSVINTEYDFQMGGLADAFRHPALIAAVASLPGGMMATVTQWSGAGEQVQAVPWTRLRDAASMAAFAAAIDAMPRYYYAAYTAVGEALVHADLTAGSNPVPCARRVIDISGDGTSNRGRAPRAVAEALAARGVTVNALVILGGKPDPAEFYRREVVRGPGSFMEITTRFDDYPAAILRKLLRELAPVGLAER